LTWDDAGAWIAAWTVADQEILVLGAGGQSPELGNDFALAVATGVCAVIQDCKD
jgi:hypothetical protein